MPHHVVTDNGVQFQGETKAMLQRYGIGHHKSSPYRPQANGAVEAANKTIKTILAKMTENFRDWADKLPYALWGYRTSVRTATGATPYSLVYGMEAVLPVEVEIQSMRVLAEAELPEKEWTSQRFEQLALMDEKRMKSLHHMQIYQKRLARTFNKKVRPTKIKKGDLVLKQSKPSTTDPRGKFKPNWEGPYLVQRVMVNGAVRLSDLEGNEFTEPINVDRLKLYFA